MVVSGPIVADWSERRGAALAAGEVAVAGVATIGSWGGWWNCSEGRLGSGQRAGIKTVS